MKLSYTKSTDGSGSVDWHFTPETPIDGEVLGYGEALFDAGLPLATIFQKALAYIETAGEPGIPATPVTPTA